MCEHKGLWSLFLPLPGYPLSASWTNPSKFQLSTQQWRKGYRCILGWFYFQEADLMIHLATEAPFLPAVTFVRWDSKESTAMLPHPQEEQFQFLVDVSPKLSCLGHWYLRHFCGFGWVLIPSCASPATDWIVIAQTIGRIKWHTDKSYPVPLYTGGWQSEQDTRGTGGSD